MSKGQMETSQGLPRNWGRGAAWGLGTVAGPTAGDPGAGQAWPGTSCVRPTSWGISWLLSFPTSAIRRLGSWDLDAPLWGGVAVGQEIREKLAGMPWSRAIGPGSLLCGWPGPPFLGQKLKAERGALALIFLAQHENLAERSAAPLLPRQPQASGTQLQGGFLCNECVCWRESERAAGPVCWLKSWLGTPGLTCQPLTLSVCVCVSVCPPGTCFPLLFPAVAKCQPPRVAVDSGPGHPMEHRGLSGSEA